MPDSFSLSEPGLFGKGKDMAMDWIPTATITWCAWTYSCWNAEAKQKKQQAKAKKHDIPVATPIG